MEVVLQMIENENVLTTKVCNLMRRYCLNNPTHITQIDVFFSCWTEIPHSRPLTAMGQFICVQYVCNTI